MNILLLIIDALRPSHLGINGHHRDTSPNIDKIAEKGAIFSNAYTVLPRSDPAIASMLTGLYPHSHGIRLIANKRMHESVTTLTEILKSHSYATAFVRSGGIPRDGTEKGFDQYDALSWKVRNKIKRAIKDFFNRNTHTGTAQQRVETVIRWINKNKAKKFFLMMHTNDLHWPYPIPMPFEHMFDPDYKGNHDYDTWHNKKYNRGDIIFGHANLPQEEINHAMAHYDGGIRYVDEQLGKLFNFLTDKDIMDDTLIILASDHGEHFGERGYYFQHGASVYEPSIKSTLIMHNPKIIPAGKKIEHRVQTMDLMPTILDVLNIPLVENIEGYSLLPLIREKEDGRKFVFAESAEEHFKGNPRVFFKGNKGKWRAMIADDWKIIYIPHPKKDIFELYNLKNDPEEKNNLIGAERKKAEEMKNKLLEFLKGQSMEGDVKVEDLSEKSRKLLVKAGYLEDQ